ncbi:MAG: hypothetical protein AABZ06_13110 [Bdellovibrionota bacterium]
MLKKTVLVTMLLALAIFSANCGGKVSDEEKTDAANIAAGLAGGMISTTDSSSSMLKAKDNDVSTMVSEMRNIVEGAIWLGQLRLESLHANNLTIPTQTCSALSNTTTGTASCTSSCPTASSFKLGCSIQDGKTSTCNKVIYTFNSTSFSVTMDYDGISGTSESNYTGTLGVSLTLNTNVTGGVLDGKLLECSMSFSFDIASYKSAATRRLTPSCDGFSCKYNGNEISCDDMKNKMMISETSCS